MSSAQLRMLSVIVSTLVPQVYSKRSSNTAKHKVLLKRRNVILALVVSISTVMYLLSGSHGPIFSSHEGRKERAKHN